MARRPLRKIPFFVRGKVKNQPPKPSARDNALGRSPRSAPTSQSSLQQIGALRRNCVGSLRAIGRLAWRKPEGGMVIPGCFGLQRRQHPIEARFTWGKCQLLPRLQARNPPMNSNPHDPDQARVPMAKGQPSGSTQDTSDEHRDRLPLVIACTAGGIGNPPPLRSLLSGSRKARQARATRSAVTPSTTATFTLTKKWCRTVIDILETWNFHTEECGLRFRPSRATTA